jgi:hypothetical protein
VGRGYYSRLTEGESVAVTGPRRCVVLELGLVDPKKRLIVDKERLEVSVEDDQQVERCERLGHHCLAILTNDAVTIMVRPYLEAECRIYGGVADSHTAGSSCSAAPAR